MPMLCDYEMIVGDKPVSIGDADSPQGKTFTFNSGNRDRDRPAFLILNVREFVHGDSTAVVEMNGVTVGEIHPYSGGTGRHWYTQMVAMGGSKLNDGDNQLRIFPAPLSGGSPSNTHDDFHIKDMFCFFRQHT